MNQGGIPQAVARFIQEKKEYQGRQLNLQSWPIFSVVRFAASIAAGVASIAATPRIAFSYGLNGDMASAGRPGVLATPADTTLQTAGQTKDQADVFIYGLSAMIAKADGALLEDVFRETDVALSTNANVVIPIGTMDLYPQAGGLYGAARSSMLQPDVGMPGGEDGGQGATVSFASNGNPTSNSFRKLDAPILWSGVGSGPDSNLQIICTPRRAITKTLAAALAAGAGVGGFTPPADGSSGSFVDVKWVLHAVSVQIRGANQ